MGNSLVSCFFDSRCSFAAANQIVTLTRMTSERVKMRRVTGSTCRRSVHFTTCAVNKP